MVVGAALLQVSPATAAGKVDFGREVLPILSENCFHCHGPDSKNRKGGLRLDTKDGAFRKKKSHQTIVPGKSGQSELFLRVASTEPNEIMPPPDSNRKLTVKQIEVLKRWIDQGAPWGQHWAFTSLPRVVELPAVKNRTWGANPIDRFVLARLEREGMTPSPEASRESWLRRVTLDLTGLPPTLAEMDAFLGDTSPQAYKTVVDRLLSSSRYGERMASDWLDVARYADTHGYQMDRSRSMWAYRDWVIRSFNRNQRFDEFLTWQLAGDLLPNATRDQRLATAFNRLHMQNEEGGIVEEEFRVAYVVDRVNTMGTAFLGMTFECSRCHDHKYDPISMKDFYGLFAFFQNIDEAGQTPYFTSSMPVPTLLLATDEQDRKRLDLEKRIQESEAAYLAARAAGESRFQKWLMGRTKAPDLPGLVAAYSFDGWKDGKVANSVNPKQPGSPLEGPKPTAGKVNQGAELSGENGFTFPGVGHFSRIDSFSLALWLQMPAITPRATVVHHSKAPVDAGSRGYELLLEQGHVAFGLHHMWPGNALKVRSKTQLPVKRWTHVTFTYDGSSRASGVKLYLDGHPAELEVVRDNLWKDITYGDEPNLTLGYRFRDNGFKGGKVDELRVFQRAVTPLEAAHLAGRDNWTQAWATPADRLSASQRAALADYYFGVVDEPTLKSAEVLRGIRREHNALIQPISEVMVMQELPRPKPAFVLKRGAYDAPGDPVTMQTPEAMPPFPPDTPRNRLGLARWLTQPDHPLTARVTVNRLWQQLFGKGIVETSDNFGSTGALPTHPELLDWLARDFVDHGWDVRRFLEQVVLSATYRQSTRITPEALARDPYNQLLGRAPARRLSAEMLRDQALAVSGLLTEKIGGPSVYPYQPEGLWNEAMGRPHYPQSSGADLYRRSLYTYWKRTVPHPQMTLFDAADRSVCSARRQTTSTPLQALGLLNDPQMVEAARGLGQRLLLEGGKSLPDQLAWAFRLVTGRRPDAREAKVLEEVFTEQRAEFARDPKATTKYLSIGQFRAVPRLKPDELAAAATVALAILNHDAAVNRR
ncbi:MAG: DUF1553 domain-containing protein [Gemmataceae bacterium]